MGRASGETGMTVDERVSAAIDNELSADDCRNLIEELGSQPEMQHAWERFHTIDAMLRGEDVDTRNRLPWDRIHANFASAQPAISGGAALAASVVLGVSLFVALQQPGGSMQGQYAVENEPTIPTATDSNPPDALATKQVEAQNQILTDDQRPDVQLASDSEMRQTPIIQPSNRSPIQQNKPNRELVRFVSDK